MQLTRSPVIRSVLSIAAVGLVLAGCTSTTSGDPSASGGTTTETVAESTSTTTSQRASGGGELADFDACEELNAVASQFALTRIAEDGEQECKARWGETTTTVRVKVFPELGVADVAAKPGSKIAETTIGSHRATTFKAPLTDTDCAVAVGIEAKSRVDFVAASTTSADEACEAATKLATAVEPKLPE
ncbi:DUF3558 family protein [Actinosynnema sp. NPDC023587]|uniref:DUF3558 family protein n=1 Tax=Actinosynnema sp. NPDC023587 TaxID=3154695 RepID=UPI0033C84DA4